MDIVPTRAVYQYQDFILFIFGHNPFLSLASCFGFPAASLAVQSILAHTAIAVAAAGARSSFYVRSHKPSL